MTTAELKAKFPEVYFIKTKVLVETSDLKLLQDNFIPDDDTPSFPEIRKGIRIYPLSITAYPSILKSMTAMEAGAWAMTKCEQQDWELSLDNFQCCLANLEMDF